MFNPPTSTNVSLSTTTQTTMSRQAPTPSVSQSVSISKFDSLPTSVPSSETFPSFHLSNDSSLVVSAIRDLRATVPSSPFFPSIYRPLVHPLSDDQSSSSNPHRSTRHPTMLELIYKYSKGHYSDEDISRLEDDRSQDISIPPQNRLPLRIAQSLTLAVNFDTTFSLEHLANRDLCLIDAFLHHRFFTSIRESIVDEAIIPSESDLNYPPVRNFSLALIVRNFKALHQSIETLKQFSTDLAQNPNWFKSVPTLLDKQLELTTLIYNVQSRRDSLLDLIAIHLFDPVEDIRLFTDLLAQFHITHTRINHILASATTSTSFAYLHLQYLVNAVKYNLNIPSESFSANEEDVPTAKHFLGLVTRDHNIDSVVQLLKQAHLSASDTSPSEASAASTAASTSSSVDTVVTAVPNQPSPPVTSTSPTPESAQPSSSSPHAHQVAHAACDSDDSSCSRISAHYSYTCQPDPSSRRTSPPRRASRSTSHAASTQTSRASSPQNQQPQRPQQQNQERDLPPCYFCSELHFSASCDNVTRLSLRYLSAAQTGRCFRCLNRHSPQDRCTRQTPCRFCREPEHHPALCPGGTRTTNDYGHNFGVFYDAMRRIYVSYYST